MPGKRRRAASYARGIGWLALAFALCGCSTQDRWTRVDGAPGSPEQVAFDEKSCQAEKQGAERAASTEPGIVYEGDGFHFPRADAADAAAQRYVACMAGRGYNREPQ